MRKILWVISMSLLFGFVIGQQLPSTFLQHPVETSKLIFSLPLGSHVVPVVGIQGSDQLKQLDWGDYGIVIGYETIKGLEKENILLCLIRIQKGSGPLVAINPIWLSSFDHARTSTHTQS